VDARPQARQPRFQSPDTPQPKPAAPPLVVPIMPAPQGAYPARLAQVMALRKQTTPEAIGALIAALGDPDANIRWLAALTLQGIGGGTVIATLRAFIEQAPSALAREEAEKVLDRMHDPERRQAA
jgi:HEAT repeat protein